ncbi:YhcB family protein [Paraferrimonas sp. SM1919]|uniref:YhcB family protein n=1 Tax=Paraferrimonas sp. SM1919 TaxID=2662263 RepID=UPI0013D59920|nr:DUF1043 family protein [Paraferrimonas sp. SM1919]
MDWVLPLITFIIGAGAGYIGHTFLINKQSPTQTQLENTRFELEQQKQELSDYFASTHEMLEAMTNHINRINEHWNESAQNMLGDETDKKLVTFSPSAPANETLDLPPKDYVKGSQKIINTKKS